MQTTWSPPGPVEAVPSPRPSILPVEADRTELRGRLEGVRIPDDHVVPELQRIVRGRDVPRPARRRFSLRRR